MEYYIKQKFLTFLRSEYEIKDAEQNTLFFAKSNMAIPFKLKIYNLEKKPVLEIRKRYFRFFTRLDIRLPENKKVLAILKAKISVFGRRFKIISKLPSIETFSLNGDILALNYTINSKNEQLATVTKKMFSFGDSYKLIVNDEENRDLYFAILLALDVAIANKKRK